MTKQIESLSLKSKKSHRQKFLMELKQSKKQNFEENLKFIHFYTAWIKSKTNKEWSREQKKLIELFYKPANKN